MSASKGSLAVFIIKNVILNTLDSVTDVTNGIIRLYCGNVQIGLLLVTFPFLPGLAVAISFIWSYLKGNLGFKESLRCSAKYLIYPIFHLFSNLKYTLNLIKGEDVERTRHDAVTLKVLEAVLEACPAVVIQVFIAIAYSFQEIDDEQAHLQSVSISLSFISICVAVMSNFDVEITAHRRRSSQSANQLSTSIMEKLLVFISCVLVLSPRIMLWATFTLYFREVTYPLTLLVTTALFVLSHSMPKRSNWRFDHVMASLFDAMSSLCCPGMFADSAIWMSVGSAFLMTFPSLLLLAPNRVFFWVFNEFDLFQRHSPQLTCFQRPSSRGHERERPHDLSFDDIFSEKCFHPRPRFCLDGESQNFLLRLFLVVNLALLYLSVAVHFYVYRRFFKRNKLESASG